MAGGCHVSVRGRAAAALVGLVWLPALAGPASPGGVAQTPPMSATGAEARIEGRTVPDIPLQLADGSERMLAELGRNRALLITFFYRRCAGVCTPYLEWINEATADVGGVGRDYRVLALSFDDADTVADLRAQARALGLLNDPDWHFAVTIRSALEEIAGALEFWYRREADSDQYDHGSLLVAVRDGRVMRALVAGPGQTQRLRELLWELRGRVVPYYATDGGPTLRCIGFDARTGAVRLDWGMLLLAAPGLASLAAALAVFRPRSNRRRAVLRA